MFMQKTIMRQINFVFTLLLLAYLPSTQTLFAQSSELALQEFAQELVKPIENLEQNPDLLTDLQDVLQPHSSFISNTFLGVQIDPEFEPYIEKYEALKGQYMGSSEPMPINPDIKILLTSSPFILASSYEKSSKNYGLCLHDFNLIVIDRGFWQYYENSDEIRETALFRQLGHCDLQQGHGQNAIMNTFRDDNLLNSTPIHWQPTYEELFVTQHRNKKIICSEENFHLYTYCDPYSADSKDGIIPPVKQYNGMTEYIWREFFLRRVRNTLPYLKCLLLDSDELTDDLVCPHKVLKYNL